MLLGFGIWDLGFWIWDFERDSHEFTNRKDSGFSLSTYYFSLISGHAVRTAFSSVRSEMFVATASNMDPGAPLGATDLVGGEPPLTLEHDLTPRLKSRGNSLA